MNHHPSAHDQPPDHGAEPPCADPGQPGFPSDGDHTDAADGGGRHREGEDPGAGQPPRIPPPRDAADDDIERLPELPAEEADPPRAMGGPPAKPSLGHEERAPVTARPALEHRVLKSLLGAWALSACSPAETEAVEEHLTDCASCAEEAVRLRDAVGLLHPAENLDLDPQLRARVLGGCLDRRPARVPVPGWAVPLDAQAARLDALLHDMAEHEWRAEVVLRWFDGRELASRSTTVGAVIGHLLAVDGLLAGALGLPDPLGPDAEHDPATRTERYWRGHAREDDQRAEGFRTLRRQWRRQGHELIRAASFATPRTVELPVPYGSFRLPVRDAFLDRAFECWVHTVDIAQAVDYPHEPLPSCHLNQLIDLAVRMLPTALRRRRRAGLAATSPEPGERVLHLEVEGNGGGDWYVPLDDGPVREPSASAPDRRPPEVDPVAHVALDGQEFCRLAAGHVPPAEALAGQDGDREVIHDVLFATASMSRM
ncbi:zf-HC2 domain-containing protein [Streptomyces sp. NPDC005438]|uniref:zf-HC2 domain-containing protein n=1 Tax=Streptomyces sp. NPDC005438 TaxID=3156880 RepID=UPI0033A3BE5D